MNQINQETPLSLQKDNCLNPVNQFNQNLQTHIQSFQINFSSYQKLQSFQQFLREKENRSAILSKSSKKQKFQQKKREKKLTWPVDFWQMNPSLASLIDFGSRSQISPNKNSLQIRQRKTSKNSVVSNDGREGSIVREINIGSRNGFVCLIYVQRMERLDLYVHRPEMKWEFELIVCLIGKEFMRHKEECICVVLFCWVADLKVIEKKNWVEKKLENRSVDLVVLVVFPEIKMEKMKKIKLSPLKN